MDCTDNINATVLPMVKTQIFKIATLAMLSPQT